MQCCVHPNVIYLSLLLQLKDCLSLIVHMPSEDKVKAAEVWNESSLKLQQMINDQHQVSNDNTKTFFSQHANFFFDFVTLCIMQFEESGDPSSQLLTEFIKTTKSIDVRLHFPFGK